MSVLVSDANAYVPRVSEIAINFFHVAHTMTGGMIPLEQLMYLMLHRTTRNAMRNITKNIVDDLRIQLRIQGMNDSDIGTVLSRYTPLMTLEGDNAPIFETR